MAGKSLQEPLDYCQRRAEAFARQSRQKPTPRLSKMLPDKDLRWTALVHLLKNQGMYPMNVEELEWAVSRLSVEKLAQFSKWFEEFMADQWDRQIEADISAGRLDAAGKRADEDFVAGRTTAL